MGKINEYKLIEIEGAFILIEWRTRPVYGLNEKFVNEVISTHGRKVHASVVAHPFARLRAAGYFTWESTLRTDLNNLRNSFRTRHCR